MPSLPQSVILCEVGPRDGFQYEERFIPTSLKVDVIERLAAAGLRRIQAVSFVHPKWVPQMADAEEIVARVSSIDGVRISGLALNRKGVERARDCGLKAVDVSIATHDRHSLDNANMTVEEALRQAIDMVSLAREHGLEAQIGFQTVFGFREPGDTPIERVLRMVEPFLELGVESISLADTTGMASPLMVGDRLDAVRGLTGEIPLVLHLHDTRGLGLANVYEALRHGVSRFDTSFGGLGGCPFIQGAAGNIATEDTAYLLESIGISTGVRIDVVADCSLRMSDFLGKPLPGKLYGLAERKS